MLQALQRIIESTDFTVVEDFDLPARTERREQIPAFLSESAISGWLRDGPGREGRLWKHQSLALDEIGRGSNVVLSTGLASGKSLVFQSAALHRILINQNERVLVFYPLKALLADQFLSWHAAAHDLGLAEGVIGGTPTHHRKHGFHRS